MRERERNTKCEEKAKRKRGEKIRRGMK